MRGFGWIAAVAALAVCPVAFAQSPYDAPPYDGPAGPTVNQRLTAPTNQADSYMGVSLGQLIMALGLTLKGVSYGPDDIRVIHSRQMAEAPPKAHEPAGDRPVAITPGNAPPSP